MTFLEILKEYDPKIEIEYPSNYYSDMRKKLASAFECLGLFDLTIFKSENQKDYSFSETSKEYIFHLLNSETTPLFRNIKSGKMTMEDYANRALEVEKLFDFIKSYVKNDVEYQKIISQISENVRYPILKRYLKSRSKYYSLITYYENLIKGDGEITGINNWVYLTADDEVKLFDELIATMERWLNLVEELGEFRADEQIEAIMNTSIEGITTYVLVENAIAEDYCEAYKKLPKKNIANSRSVKSMVTKIKGQNDEAYKLKLDLAKKYCDEHDIDFQQYLAEKEYAESKDFEPIPTESAFKIILKDIN